MSAAPETVTPRVTVLVDVDQAITYNSYVFSGVLSLVRRGRIVAQIRHVDYGRDDARERGRIYIELDVEWPSGRGVRVFIDMHDRADLFYPTGLERAGLYFKRSYAPADAGRVGMAGDRIEPFGAMFPVATFACKRLILRALIKRHGLARRHTLSVTRQINGLPDYNAFLALPAGNRPNGALLRTRLWEENEVRGADTAVMVNDERIRWIRELKSGLGSRFVGGVLPTPLAERLCPELIDRSPIGRKAYLKDLRNSAISIYTRGLHRSTAWKLPESMAAGCAVVGEPLSHILPEPLEDRVHLLHASTPEACVQSCHALLDNPDALFEVQRNGRAYFDSYMHPEQRMARVLARAAEVAGEVGLSGQRPIPIPTAAAALRSRAID